MEILSRTEFLGYDKITLLLYLIMAFIVSLVIGLIVMDFNYFMYSILISLCILFVVGECTKCGTGIYEYEVIINDDAAAKDILDNYQFVEKRGDIYVIRDKLD